jgi:hypothetical protein
MRVNVVHRIIVTAAVGAVALVGFVVPGHAQASQDQTQQEERKPDDPKGQKEKKPQNAKAQARGEQNSQQPQRARLAPEQQQVRIQQQEQRTVQYRQHLEEQQRAAQQQSVQLQQQNRRAQVTYQQQYVAGLHQQQLRIQGRTRYNYGGDPYFYTASSVRYSRGGRYYETNQYGAALLRQAVNYGYDQGVRAGRADRQDRWASGYQSSYAYQDANYGYSGFYVDRDDYNNYFREGFRRGYEDGYGGRYRYGTYTNGKGILLGAILATIITFDAIR